MAKISWRDVPMTDGKGQSPSALGWGGYLTTARKRWGARSTLTTFRVCAPTSPGAYPTRSSSTL
jgi:hypothetical protein